MKIKLLADCLITFWTHDEESEEEFHQKDTIFDELDYIGNCTTNDEKHKFAQFQNGDSSVFILEIGGFEVLENCSQFEEEMTKI